MDVALAIEKLVPGANYGGSTTANTRSQYEALRWKDERKKPTWEELEAVEIDPVEEQTSIEDRISELESKVKDVDSRIKSIEQIKKV